MIAKSNLFAIVLLIILRPINAKLVQKCCDSRSGLYKLENSSSYSCGTHFEDSVLPLLKGRNGQAILEDSSSGDVCVDKLLNGTIVELQLAPGGSVQSISRVDYVQTYYKCCPRKHFYNYNNKSCTAVTSDETMMTTGDGLKNVEIGMPDCNNGAMVDLEAEGSLKMSSNDQEVVVFDLISNSTQVFSVNESCIDSVRQDEHTVKYAIRTCRDLNETCEKMSCVRKCCPHGHMYRFSAENKPACLPAWNFTFEPFQNNESGVSESSENFAVIQHGACQYGRKLVNSDKVSLFPNGTLLIETVYHIHVHEKRYCMENIEFPGNSAEMITTVCNSTPVVNKYFYHHIGSIISCIFLALTLFVYCFLPELRNTHGKTVMCHVSSMLVAYSCLALAQCGQFVFPKNVCTALGYTIAFTLFASFSWLTVMCFDIWWTFGALRAHVKVKKMDKKFIYYCAFAFGLPVVLVLPPVIADFTDIAHPKFQPKIGYDSCWFNADRPWAHGVFFILPIAVLISSNIVMFALTARYCVKVMSNINSIQDGAAGQTSFLADKQILITTFKLSIVMGLSWVFEIVSTYVKEPKMLWNILDSLNVLQGVWIFIIFVMKPRVWGPVLIKLGIKFNRATSQPTQQSDCSNTNPTTEEVWTKKPFKRV